MENRGLLFIPDISGFSRFVNAVELEHSRFIIQQFNWLRVLQLLLTSCSI